VVVKVNRSALNAAEGTKSMKEKEKEVTISRSIEYDRHRQTGLFVSASTVKLLPTNQFIILCYDVC
jgi:hypothetical protein